MKSFFVKNLKWIQIALSFGMSILLKQMAKRRRTFKLDVNHDGTAEVIIDVSIADTIGSNEPLPNNVIKESINDGNKQNT